MTLPDSLSRRLPAGVDVLASSIRRSRLALAWRRLGLARVQGRCAASGRTATVVVAGESPVNNYILQTVFDGATERTPLGRCWLGALPKRLRDLEQDADLLIARVETGVSEWLFGDTGLRLPESIDARIAVPGPDERWPPTHSARSNTKRVVRNALTWSISRDPADFDLFYDEMYVPFVRDRFGALGTVTSRTALRYRFARGGLQWIWQGSDRVGGQVLEPEGRQLRCVVMGCDPARNAAQLGLVAATFLFAMEYARRHGFDVVDRGGTLPSLCDPVLTSKHFWGADFATRSRATHDLLVVWPAWNSLAATFLASFAPIHRDGTDLIGFTARHPDDPAGKRRRVPRLDLRGLSKLFAVGAADPASANRVPVTEIEPGSSKRIVSAAKRMPVDPSADQSDRSRSRAMS
ncbi:MAG: hypothetical protein MI806_10600 [Minwuiales bacterium]|nr:hypothetical protein [Minwuiales bacterium]